ncbi:major facilitator superfamily transporter [Seiridium cupressi]
MASHDIEKSTKGDTVKPLAMAASINDGSDGKASDVVADIVHAAEAEYTAAQYASVLRKADWILLPLMWIVSGTHHVDKVSVSTQATFGHRIDTNLVGQQYSWLTSIFYIAYLISEAPGNYLMQKANIRYMISVSMLIWGVLALCVAFCRNFAELMVPGTIGPYRVMVYDAGTQLKSDVRDGQFAADFKRRGTRILIGEVLNEETFYATYNAPEEPNLAALRLQIGNYYAPSTTNRIIEQYSLPKTDNLSEWRHGPTEKEKALMQQCIGLLVAFAHDDRSYDFGTRAIDVIKVVTSEDVIEVQKDGKWDHLIKLSDVFASD